jgi:antitoxin HicB
VEEYLNLPYTIELHYDASRDNPGWVAQVVELPGCLTQGDTFEELEAMITEAMRAWIETALEDGQPIPSPRPAENYSGRFVTRVPRSLHRELALAAEREGVSLNTFVNVALSKAVAGQS